MSVFRRSRDNFTYFLEWICIWWALVVRKSGDNAAQTWTWNIEHRISFYMKFSKYQTSTSQALSNAGWNKMIYTVLYLFQNIIRPIKNGLYTFFRLRAPPRTPCVCQTKEKSWNILYARCCTIVSQFLVAHWIDWIVWIIRPPKFYFRICVCLFTSSSVAVVVIFVPETIDKIEWFEYGHSSEAKHRTHWLHQTVERTLQRQNTICHF